MFFDRIRRAAAWLGLPAALALAAPVGTASAATHQGPTALTITPAFARTVGADASAGANAGLIEVAQNRRGATRRYPRRSANRSRVRRSASRNQTRRAVRSNRTRRAANRTQTRRTATRRAGRQVAQNNAQRRRNANRRETRRVARRQARRTARRTTQRVNRRYRRRAYYRGRWWTYNNGYYYDDAGVAIAAGIIGLAAGALVGSAIANDYDNDVVIVDDGDYGIPAPYTAEWYRRCDVKYRSFRASDGTYLGYDGVRHTCRLP